MTIQEIVRRSRQRARLTQEQLAHLAGTSQPAVHRYERGEALPSIPTLERLLRACGRELSIRSVPLGRGDRPASARSQLGPQATRLRHERARLMAAARRNGARNIRVFGSVARGEDTPESDVDLLVDLEPGKTLLGLAAFRRQAAEIIGANVDVATADMLKEHVRNQALNEAIPL